jgi:hypothetical protein
MVQAHYGFAVGLICDRLLRARRDGDTGESLQDRANIAYQRTVSRSVDCAHFCAHAHSKSVTIQAVRVAVRNFSTGRKRILYSGL